MKKLSVPGARTPSPGPHLLDPSPPAPPNPAPVSVSFPHSAHPLPVQGREGPGVSQTLKSHRQGKINSK